MKLIKQLFNLASLPGALLTLPALYFIFISVMKNVAGRDYFFDASASALEIMGILDAFGWNITLFVILGSFIDLSLYKHEYHLV